MSTPLSRVEEILSAKSQQGEYSGAVLSRIEEILLSMDIPGSADYEELTEQVHTLAESLRTLPELFFDGASAYLSDIAQDSGGSYILDSDGNAVILRLCVGTGTIPDRVNTIENRLARIEYNLSQLIAHAIADNNAAFMT